MDCNIGAYQISWEPGEIFISKTGVGNVLGERGSLRNDDPRDKPIYDAMTYDITEEEIERLLRLWEMLQ